VLPLTAAVILAVPAATPVTVNGAVDDPAGIVIGDCTVATAGLLLVNVTLAAAAGAAAIDTVPCAVPPIPIVDGLRATLDSPGPVVVAEVGELEPHRLAHTAADKSHTTEASRDGRHRFIIGY
jgi:hypothetical protein